MAIEDLMPDAFTVLKHAGTDEYGKDIAKTPGDTGKGRFVLTDGESVVDNEGEDVLISGRVYLPAGVDITEEDDLTIDGITFRVLQRREPKDACEQHHIRLAVRRL